ncbi:MAG: SIMPL domain-containing protein [Deltaproteobacteria bacterium]|nr:SIMPL domain-containing protein [Deltaproteobacteria bacterium]
MKKTLTLGITLLVFLLGLHPATAADEKPLPQLRLRGEADLQVPADRLNLSLGVVTDAATVDEALGSNSKKMEAIISALKKTGLQSKDYQTSRFNIQPQWSSRPKQAPSDWRPHIVGYRVSSQLAIHTEKLELAGKLIESAVSSGANEVGAIYFDLSDPRRYRAQAIETAAANARADAQVMAAAAGVKILRVLALNLDQAQAFPRDEPFSSGMLKSMAAEAAAPPIESGDIRVRATIDMVCEIAPAQ